MSDWKEIIDIIFDKLALPSTQKILEWIRAKEDPAVDTSWVETCCCPDNDAD